MKRSLNSLEDFIENTHKLGYTLVDYNDVKIPVLYIDDAIFEQILSMSYSQKVSIDTNLNIYDDGEHVFVDMNLKFFETGLEQNYLLYANETIDFFSNLAIAGMMGLAPSNKMQNNIFFIQLPKKDRAEIAYEMIKEKLKL